MNDKDKEREQLIEELNQLRQRVTELEQLLLAGGAAESTLEELRLANERLQEMDRVKNDFLSMVSHEMRTPLTSIKSFAEILLNYDDDREIRREFLGIINDESDRLTRLINDFLDISKIESGKVRWDNVRVDLDSLIRSVITANEVLLDKMKLSLELDIEPDMPLVWGDRDRFSQVLTNLISNAAKFTPEGGRIIVSAGVISEETAEGDPSMVRVSVIDNGKGISPEDLEGVFDKFSQVNHDTGGMRGTGLGLSICREIVSYYGGSIWAESEFGQGSTFSFTLPVAPSLEVEEAEAREEAAVAPNGVVEAMVGTEIGNAILVVDDDKALVRAITYELQQRGFSTAVAYDGEEAIAEARNNTPDLIILDMMLPKMSGPDVIRELKKDPETAGVPIIILTGIQLDGNTLKDFPTEASGFFTKSGGLGQVFESVSRLLNPVDLGVKPALPEDSKEGSSKSMESGDRVLVVDDDKALARAVTYELNQRGFVTDVAYDGEEALAAVQRYIPNLIILDMMLPKIGGTDVLRELKSKPETAGIPVIVMTGVQLSSDSFSQFPSGVDGFFTKAGGLSSLLESTAQILTRKPGP